MEAGFVLSACPKNWDIMPNQKVAGADWGNRLRVDVAAPTPKTWKVNLNQSAKKYYMSFVFNEL